MPVGNVNCVDKGDSKIIADMECQKLLITHGILATLTHSADSHNVELGCHSKSLSGFWLAIWGKEYEQKLVSNQLSYYVG